MAVRAPSLQGRGGLGDRELACFQKRPLDSQQIASGCLSAARSSPLIDLLPAARSRPYPHPHRLT